MPKFSAQELEEFEFRQRAEQELAAQNKPSTEMPEVDSTSETTRTLGMGGAGAVLGAASKKMPGFFSPTKPSATPTGSVVVSGAPTAPGVSAVDAARSGLSNEISQQVRTSQRAQRTEQAAKVLEDLKRKGVPVDPKILASMPEQHARPSGILLSLEEAKKIEQAEQALAGKTPLMKKVATQAPQVAKQVLSAPLSGLGRGVAGLGMGLQAADVINRYKRDDIPGAVISGVGTIGTGLAAIPHPITRLGGSAISIGAEGLNAYLDYLKKQNREGAAAPAPTPSPESTMAPPMARGGKVQKKTSKAEQAANHLKKLKMAAGGYIAMKEGGHTTPAWQRAEGKSPSGGLNALGRASYKRETGGTLKAPQPEGGSRKKSFCARMGGMKKKLTSSKTANDPDSRINKALRKWKC